MGWWLRVGRGFLEKLEIFKCEVRGGEDILGKRWVVTIAWACTPYFK